jgi:hypothetical protein
MDRNEDESREREEEIAIGMHSLQKKENTLLGREAGM